MSNLSSSLRELGGALRLCLLR
ncbi:rCG57573, partial [Rattus norvegicus]